MLGQAVTLSVTSSKSDQGIFYPPHDGVCPPTHGMLAFLAAALLAGGESGIAPSPRPRPPCPGKLTKAAFTGMLRPRRSLADLVSQCGVQASENNELFGRCLSHDILEACYDYAIGVTVPAPSNSEIATLEVRRSARLPPDRCSPTTPLHLLRRPPTPCAHPFRFRNSLSPSSHAGPACCELCFVAR